MLLCWSPDDELLVVVTNEGSCCTKGPDLTFQWFGCNNNLYIIMIINTDLPTGRSVT